MAVFVFGVLWLARLVGYGWHFDACFTSFYEFVDVSVHYLVGYGSGRDLLRSECCLVVDVSWLRADSVLVVGW